MSFAWLTAADAIAPAILAAATVAATVLRRELRHRRQIRERDQIIGEMHYKAISLEQSLIEVVEDLEAAAVEIERLRKARPINMVTTAPPPPTLYLN